MKRVPRGLRNGVVLILFSCVSYMLTGCAESPEPESVSVGVVFPSFPWPPPRASATELISRDVFLRGNENVLLSDVDKQLNSALQQNGYFDKKYYAVPEGFALVTRLEQIEKDGSPKPQPQRWELEDDALRGPFTLNRIISALFRARPGFYRVIVFTITPHPFEQADAKVSAESAMEWLAGGFNRLPASTARLSFSRGNYDCTVLIYEFERPTGEKSPELRSPGLPGRVHLVKAGIWDSLRQ